MTDIDWSKAQYSDTHYDPINRVFVNFDAMHDWDRKLIPRPAPQCSGDGRPPVGTVCEARIPHHTASGLQMLWCEVEILAHAIVQGVEYSWVKELGADGGFYAPMMLTFRPIKTPAQIVAEEREAAAVELAGILSGHDHHVTVRDIEMAKYLYDIGYRRTEKVGD